MYSGKGQNSDYLAINPLGQIPSLTDGHVTLRESNAILIYLAEKYGDLALYGSTAEQRADVNQWLFWESSQRQPLLTSLLADGVGHQLLPELIPAPQSQPQWGSQQVTHQLAYLENALLDRKWLTGQTLSLADYSVAAMTTYFRVSEFPYQSYPNISAWQLRLSDQVSWQKTEHPMWR